MLDNNPFISNHFLVTMVREGESMGFITLISLGTGLFVAVLLLIVIFWTIYENDKPDCGGGSQAKQELT